MWCWAKFRLICFLRLIYDADGDTGWDAERRKSVHNVYGRLTDPDSTKIWCKGIQVFTIMITFSPSEMMGYRGYIDVPGGMNRIRSPLRWDNLEWSSIRFCHRFERDYTKYGYTLLYISSVTSIKKICCRKSLRERPQYFPPRVLLAGYAPFSKPQISRQYDAKL